MSPIEEEIITITGHRVYPDRAALYRGLDQYHARRYYFGGARGVDNDALQYITKTQPGSVRTVVVPNRVMDQPFSVRGVINRDATNIIELKNTGADRFMIRNRYMVDRSTRVNAFYDFRGRGGTYNTIEYARSIDRPFTVQPMVDINYEKFMNMPVPEFDNWVKQMKHFKVNLRSVKGIIVNFVKNIRHMSMGDYCKGIGYPGCNTLEQMWSR